MTRVLGISFALALCLFVPKTPFAQSPFDSIQTVHGRCELWAAIPGVSNPSDSSYNRCALERGPVLRAGAQMPPPPLSDLEVSGEFTVIVNADGTVDPRLTRMWTRTSDTAFYRSATETIRQWRFEPGIRRGAPVRSGFRLEIQSTTRTDTLPAKLAWRYKQGLNTDSLTGTWVADAAVLPFGSATIDSIYTALLRRLIKMQVVTAGSLDPYCLVVENDDSVAHARLSRLGQRIINPPRGYHPSGVPLAGYGCERSTRPRRIVIPRVHRTENGRAVLFPSGDYLRIWPPGFDGTTWRAWSGRCVARVPARARVSIDCSVMPEMSHEEIVDRNGKRGQTKLSPLAKRSDDDSVRVTVLITTREAYQRDTLNAVLHALPRLSVRAINDSLPPCAVFDAYSPKSSAELYILLGNPFKWPLRIWRVKNEPAPSRSPATLQCGPQEPRLSEFFTFLLGDVGDRPNAPITVCFEQCAWSYVLNPDQHILAERAHVRFRLADLREDTRAGDQLTFRIHVDPAPENLMPFVLIRERNQWSSAWVADPVTANVWEYGVIQEGGYASDTEVRIYLIRR